MRQKQLEEIKTLDKIINDSISISKWDWINNWASWKYADDKILFIEWWPSIIPEEIYFKINWGGKKWYTTWYIEQKIRVNKLLKAKERYDLSMTQWIQDIREWILWITELYNDWFIKESKIIFDKLKSELLPAWVAWDMLLYSKIK